jgi:hypothetical protein
MRYVEKHARAVQATEGENITRHMRFPCNITKTTDTRWTYIIFTTFKRQQCCGKRASMLRLQVHWRAFFQYNCWYRDTTVVVIGAVVVVVEINSLKCGETRNWVSIPGTDQRFLSSPKPAVQLWSLSGLLSRGYRKLLREVRTARE